MEKYLKRSAGVLMPIFSLPGDHSCGSFGREAEKFIDLLVKGGFSYWQVLPFCMTDEYNSPYKSYSAFGGNPRFIDLEALNEKGLITGAELAVARQKTPYSCEHERLEAERLPLLFRAAARVKDRAPVEVFIAEHPYIEQVCRFMAIREKNGDRPWFEWTTEEYDSDVLFAWQFIQYEFFTQWARVKSYAAERGVKIIGDIPIYVAYDSCDVWANRDMFRTDEEGKPSSVAGVPPDYFAAEGQLWGNPLYDWDKMRDDGYTWWRARMAHMLSLFDGVRIDHFRGLEAYWSIPADAETAKAGHWVKGPGEDFVAAMKSLSEDGLIIAEDLGDITPEVAALRDSAGYPGMRVLQFGFLGDTDSPHLPHNYINNCIAYTGTHDNNTLLGWMWDLDAETKELALDYFNYSGDWDKSYKTIIKAMLASAAGIVILPIQDLLIYGSDTRLNRPGVANGNWMYRVTREQLSAIDWEHYAHLNRLYARA